MKKILLLVIGFIGLNLHGQTLVDSTTESISKLIYASDGTAIGKDSIYRKTYHYTENSKDVYNYVDSLIMRISYLNTQATLWYQGSGNGVDETLVSGVNNCDDGCDNFKVVFDQATVNGYIDVGIDRDRIIIKQAGFYEIKYSFIINCIGSGLLRIGLSSDFTSFSDFARTITHENLTAGVYQTITYTTLVYMYPGDVYLYAMAPDKFFLANYYLNVKLKI